MQNEVPCLCAHEESASCKPEAPLSYLHLAPVPAQALRAVLLLWPAEPKVWRAELQHGQGQTQTRREEPVRCIQRN